MLQSAKQLGGIEAGSLFAEPAFVLQVVEELSAIGVRQTEVQLVCCLEGEFETVGERESKISLSGKLE